MSFSIGKRVWAIPMPATDKLVLLALAHYADDNGQCWPSLDKLGKDTGLHPKSVSRCIRRLKKSNAQKDAEEVWLAGSIREISRTVYPGIQAELDYPSDHGCTRIRASWKKVGKASWLCIQAEQTNQGPAPGIRAKPGHPAISLN